jgi:hypothetical protein
MNEDKSVFLIYLIRQLTYTELFISLNILRHEVRLVHTVPKIVGRRRRNGDSKQTTPFLNNYFIQELLEIGSYQRDSPEF